MGAGASFNYAPEFKRKKPHNQFGGGNSPSKDLVVEQKQAADFRGVRQLSLPILQTKIPEGPIRRPLKTQQSIKAMSLRNRCRHEHSYRIQKELASSLVSLHKQNYPGDKLAPTKARTHERIDSILTTLDCFSNRDKVNDDQFPVKTDAIIILRAERQESNMTALPPHRKSGFALAQRKRPTPLKMEYNAKIEDNSDWIQVDDEDGGEFPSPRVKHGKPLQRNKESDQSYIFTQSGTIFVEGFLEGIGKEGIVGAKSRELRLPMRDRLVLLCKLGNGASGVVYKALDLIEMRLVALKMISVYENGKRRQMVRELSALFQVLRQKKLDFKIIQSGGKLKTARSQFSLRPASQEVAMKDKLRAKAEELKAQKLCGTANSNCPPSSSCTRPGPLVIPNCNTCSGSVFLPPIGSSSSSGPSRGLFDETVSNRIVRRSELKLLETVKEQESEKTVSPSMGSSCSTPDSSGGGGGDGVNESGYPKGPCDRSSCTIECREDEHNVDEYGIRIEKEFFDDDEEDQTGLECTETDAQTTEDVSALEKFFVKPASEFIVDFYDAFSNIDDGGVALMMEYMDGGSLQDIVNDGGCDDEITLSNIAVQALIGLAFLHSCGQLHRDLKPGNFLISHRGDVKVADLGILCQLDDRRASSQLPGIDADGKAKRPTDRQNDKSAPLLSISSDREIEREIESARERERTPVEVLSDTAEASDNEETPSPPRMVLQDDYPMPHTKTFVGTVTFMSPERIDGKEYSYPSDVWAFGLSLMTLALGVLPIDTNGGYWTILHCIRDAEPPSLPDDGRFSDDFRNFLSSCLQKNPKDRLTCNELLLHPFLRKAVPEECGIGAYLNSISGKNSKKQSEAESEANEVQRRGILELHSILSALHLHFERIQLGISPKSGLQITEATQNHHSFFSGLQTTKIEAFLRLFLLGNGIVVEEENEVERCVQCVLESSPMMSTPSFTGGVDDVNKLNTLAKQLHLSPERIKDEIRIYCEGLRNKHEKPPRRFSRVATPKAMHGTSKDTNKASQLI